MAQSKLVTQVAYGLAWSYYCGYLRLLSPSMKKRIRDTLFYKDAQESYGSKVMCDKMFIMIPDSCQAPAKISDRDAKVTHAGFLEDELLSRAGNVDRPYRNNVYQTTTDDGTEYYFVVEYATPLQTLFEMTEIKESGLTEDDRTNQRIVFTETMQHILDNVDKTSVDKTGPFVLIPFQDKIDGKVRPVADVIVEAINKNI